MSNKDNDKDETSRLEALPRELRDQIYGYVVIEDGLVISARQVSTWPRRRKSAVKTFTSQRVEYISGKTEFWIFAEPALAMTSKQFREEILPIYYAQNTFTFPLRVDNIRDTTSFEAWLETASERASKIVRVGAELSDEGAKCVVTAMVEDGQPVRFEVDGYLYDECDCALRAAREDDRMKPGVARSKRLAEAMWLCYSTLIGKSSPDDGTCGICGQRNHKLVYNPGSDAWLEATLDKSIARERAGRQRMWAHFGHS